MATGRALWPCVSDPISAMYLIRFSDEVPEIPSSLSKQGRDFVTKCLMRDPMEKFLSMDIWELTHQSGCSNLARGRIRLLSEGKAASFLGATNWVIVRSNDIEHPNTTLHWNEYEVNDIYDDEPQPRKTNAKTTCDGGLGLDTSEAASFSSRQRKKSRA
ncbi:hypothetical protein GBA52_016522 [Prunus armeniaca]|nr:hypothetical protein GBA52_016522 [Prunus armeniaca]